jgi:hypothetical protein|tara:strand:+ start:217 stop:720 length:504 start_codon:yes stop_codon:yes gene_type:complete
VPDSEVARLLTEIELENLEKEIERWLDLSLKENPLFAAFERDSDEPAGESRWFIRVLGEEKDTFTLRFMLRQRMLHYETYVMPAPDENKELFFENILIRNRKIVGATFCLGEEDAVFLIGAIPASTVEPNELDRILGTLWVAVEQNFKSLLKIGFASKFAEINKENK